MLLTQDGKQDFLKSEFHQFFDINLAIGNSTRNINANNITQFCNFVMPLSELNKKCNLTAFMKFFNNEYNNVIFTSQDNQHIYRYEVYQKVYFIRIYPFSQQIRMHFLPKEYDASDSKTDLAVLLFKDNKQTINSNNYSASNKYTRKTDRNTINSYYNANTNQTSNCMYMFDIRDKTQNLINLQINSGYSYNDTNPTNKIKHYTGVLDKSDADGKPITASTISEYNNSLIDANMDNYSNQSNIKKIKYNNTNIDWANLINTGKTINVNHVKNTLYHKTLKYFNGDTLYIEENGQYTSYAKEK